MGSTALDFRALMKKEKAAMKKHPDRQPQPFAPLAVKGRFTLCNCEGQVGPVRGVAYLADFITKDDAERLLAAIDQVSRCADRCSISCIMAGESCLT